MNNDTFSMDIPCTFHAPPGLLAAKGGISDLNRLYKTIANCQLDLVRACTDRLKAFVRNCPPETRRKQGGILYKFLPPSKHL